MRGAARMHLAVEAQRLGEVRDLHAARDAHVVFGIGAHEVGAAGDDEVRLRLDAAHVLGLQDRRLEHLAQLAMAEGRDAGIPVRVLVPEIAEVVAGAADIERVGEGPQLAGGVEHERHLVGHLAADIAHVLRLLPGVALVPAMDLEAAIAEVEALLGEGGELLLAVEAAAAVGVVGRGIGLEPAAIAAEELADRGAELPAREVPERDVDRPVPVVVVLAQLALEVVVDLLAVVGVAAQQERRQRQRLRQRRPGAAPERHVLAARAVLARDDHGVLGQQDRRPLLVGDAGMGAGTLQVQVPRGERELVDLDQVDDAHGPRSSCRLAGARTLVPARRADNPRRGARGPVSRWQGRPPTA